MKIGLIGAGGIATAHLPAWVEQGHDVRVYTADGKAADLVGRFGGTVADSFDDVLAWCDAADVCTPTPTHRAIVEQAAAAGVHVMCEKPLARTSADARAAVAACAEAGVLLFPAHVVRFFPAYRAANEAVQRGDIGAPGVLRFSRIAEFPGRSGWYADEAQSGGILMDLMIHDLDQARRLAGPAASIYAVRRQRGAGDRIVGAAHAVVTHASGAISHCASVWSPPGTTFRTTFDLAGSDGILSYDSTAHPGLEFDGARSSERPETAYLPPMTSAETPYAAEIREFATAITTGAAVSVTAADGIAAVDLALAGMKSLETGQRIELAEQEVAT
ncbi:Gfo/Idh/MocA family protein [Spelaeicoccus albus]|uniref:Myo-inositol 2-dehydrogenase/D-chiro-inositol 1-dehydrogenase n=1 Tax=Spelaeicoccus albus TaxID=1280376 RepID=A0A7Z0D0F9_9MICO|nr:Gfo/Idh/MocA family oxidoreductase [Spelaeicoccus albus]NYI67316.1 myo-inositol 2-dehydrogenase/D-chiro-inositol 1-dehydrogenase [Spelaeicoccus albus]